ncbi:hypothetical protein [Terasakiella pusilla]|uniref:hypothetical protein n=1 Tax=Terasakiella pusilla TaxID=64973 RepID=UPI00048BB5DC|nr:hypothetical protein [Terasakiella pusilla]
MKYFANGTPPYKIDFHIELETPSTEEKFGFIVLLEAKFMAEITYKGRFDSGTEICGSVELSFDSYDNYDGAIYHCRDKLTDAGEVKKDYVGALEYADRGGLMTKKLIKEIEKMDLSNSDFSQSE